MPYTCRRVVTIVAASFLGASAASAPAPEPAPPRIDALAQSLRAEGFSAQAAKNYAVFTHVDLLR